MAIKTNKILFLTLRTFSDTGGVQKVSRTLCKTLADLSNDQHDLQVLSLYDQNIDVDERYLSGKCFEGFGNRRIYFSIKAILIGLVAKGVVLSHINLLPIALAIKIIRPRTSIILLAHGIEVWRSLPNWKIKFLNKNTRIWSVSNFTAEKLHQNHHIHRHNISILNNCLDPFFKKPIHFTKPLHLLHKYNLTATQPILLCITRITPNDQNKGYDQMIQLVPELLKKFPTLCYLLAGNADQNESIRLQTLIAANNLQKHVKLIGFIDEEELINHYLLADIFILISKKEGFGLVFTEAAACGCQIICGNKDGSTDAVLNGKLGKPIDPMNSWQLQTTITALLKSKNHLTDKLKTQQMCLQHFNYQRYKQKVKNLLS